MRRAVDHFRSYVRPWLRSILLLLLSKVSCTLKVSVVPVKWNVPVISVILKISVVCRKISVIRKVSVICRKVSVIWKVAIVGKGLGSERSIIS